MKFICDLWCMEPGKRIEIFDIDNHGRLFRIIDSGNQEIIIEFKIEEWKRQYIKKAMENES